MVSYTVISDYVCVCVCVCIHTYVIRDINNSPIILHVMVYHCKSGFHNNGKIKKVISLRVMSK